MQRALLFAVFAACIAFNSSSIAQATNPLVGAWERVSQLDAEGKPSQQLTPQFVIFTADGFFSHIALPVVPQKSNKPAGRPRNDDLNQMTREQLVQRFDSVGARWGTYTVKDNLLTRTDIRNLNANFESAEQLQFFRIEGDVLIVSNARDPKSKSEARYRRAR